MVASFLEILFPPDISYGLSGGPGYDSTIVQFESGKEQRNLNRDNGLSAWSVGAVKSVANMQAIYSLFRQVRGDVWGFRYHDWLDYQLTDEPIGTADGSAKTFNVIKTYGSSNPEVRRIRKLANAAMSIAGGVTYPDPSIKIAGTPRSSGVTIDVNAGTVALAVGLPSGLVTLSGCFHCAARFGVKQLNFTYEDRGIQSWRQIPILEIDPSES